MSANPIEHENRIPNVNQPEIIDHDTDEEDFGQIKLLPEPCAKSFEKKHACRDEFWLQSQEMGRDRPPLNQIPLRKNLEFVMRDQLFINYNKYMSNLWIATPKQISTEDFLKREFVYVKKDAGEYGISEKKKQKFFISHHSQNKLYSYI